MKFRNRNFLKGIKNKNFSLNLLLMLMMNILLSSCNDESSETIPDENKNIPIKEGSWVTYSPYKWSHDGYPYYSEYCSVYSDGASNEMKMIAGKFTDRKFIEILEFFNYTDYANLRYPADNRKIDVYLNTGHPENIAAAYWGSIFITVRTQYLDTILYEYLFKHELTHSFEFLIEGTVNLGTDLWFKEGIAMIGGGGLNVINNLQDLELWISGNSELPNKGNPISIHKWEDFSEGDDIHGFCMVFELVMKYILDPEGLDGEIDDILNLFYDVRNGEKFDIAFQNNFSISVEKFKDEIFERLRLYLSRTGLKYNKNNLKQEVVNS